MLLTTKCNWRILKRHCSTSPRLTPSSWKADFLCYIMPWIFAELKTINCAISKRIIECLASFIGRRFSKYISLENMLISWCEIIMPRCSMFKITSKWITNDLLRSILRKNEPKKLSATLLQPNTKKSLVHFLLGKITLYLIRNRDVLWLQLDPEVGRLAYWYTSWRHCYCWRM